MKLTWLAIVVFILLILLLGVFIGKSCDSDESLTSINNAMAQRDKNLTILQKKMEGIDSAIKALRIERNEIKNYYSNKYYQIDSLANIDSLIINGIIRARTERLFRLPGFFDFTIDSLRVGVSSKNSSSW